MCVRGDMRITHYRFTDLLGALKFAILSGSMSIRMYIFSGDGIGGGQFKFKFSPEQITMLTHSHEL